MITQKDLKGKIPIHRGCNATDGCFCTGRCKEVIGYLVDGKIEYLQKVDDNLKQQYKDSLFQQPKLNQFYDENDPRGCSSSEYNDYETALKEWKQKNKLQ